MARGDQHRDRECPVHTGTCLVETTSGDQLICPLWECSHYEPTKLPAGKKSRKVRR